MYLPQNDSDLSPAVNPLDYENITKMNSLLRSLAPKVVDHFGKRALSTSNQLFAFWERDDRGGYDYKPLPDFKTRMRVGLSEMRNEIKLWCQEWKEKFESRFIYAFYYNTISPSVFNIPLFLKQLIL